MCKKLFFDVFVLCSGNKKQTKTRERGIHLHRPAMFLSVLLSLFVVAAAFHSHRPAGIECRVFPAGCSYSLAMH